MELLCYALTVYTIVLFGRFILSWVTMFWSPPSALTPVISGIYELTEPVLRLFRRYIPAVGGLDLSFIFVFLVIRFVQTGLGC